MAEQQLTLHCWGIKHTLAKLGEQVYAILPNTVYLPPLLQIVRIRWRSLDYIKTILTTASNRCRNHGFSVVCVLCSAILAALSLVTRIPNSFATVHKAEKITRMGGFSSYGGVATRYYYLANPSLSNGCQSVIVSERPVMFDSYSQPPSAPRFHTRPVALADIQ